MSFKEDADTIPGAPTFETVAEPPDRIKRIRCPKCQWEPRRNDLWVCTSCGCNWNTFDTAGKCPQCSRQWQDTKCLHCMQWSKHSEWYEA